jgi:hypothetical protein
MVAHDQQRFIGRTAVIRRLNAGRWALLLGVMCLVQSCPTTTPSLANDCCCLQQEAQSHADPWEMWPMYLLFFNPKRTHYICNHNHRRYGAVPQDAGGPQ